MVLRGWRFAAVEASSLDPGLAGLGFEAEAEAEGAVESGLGRLRMRAASAPWAVCCGIDGRWRVRCMESMGMATRGCGLDGYAWVASARCEIPGDA